MSTDPELDRMLRNYLAEEKGTRAAVDRVGAKVDQLGAELHVHVVDDERRHGEVLTRLESHELRLVSSEAWGGWVRKVFAALVVAALAATAARVF